MRSRHFKALLIIYFIILIQSLKTALSKPKHVAMFFYIVYIIKLC